MTATTWTPPTYNGPARTVRLSPMRADTLECLCRGMSSDEIADALLVTANTVKTHVRDLLKVLGARDRTQAVVLALTGQVRVEIGDVHSLPRAA